MENPSLQIVTAVINDPHDDNSIPLIYAVYVPGYLLIPEADGKDILNPDENAGTYIGRAIQEQRRVDFGSEYEESEIEILFVFEGDLSPIFDYR